LFALGNSSDYFLLLVAQTKFELGLLSVIGLWIALHISKIVFSVPGGVLSDRLGRRPVIIAGWAIYAMVYLGLALADAQWQFWALLLLYGFYYGMTEGGLSALVTDFAPSEHRGAAFGIYHGAVGIAALPANLMFGLIWRHYKTAGPSLVVGACLAGAASLLLAVLLAKKKSNPPAPRAG
jgi:MFS family permease